MIVGSGAREVMMIKKLAQSRFNVEITVTGKYLNSSIYGNATNIVIVESNIENIISKAIKYDIDLAIVSDEEYIKAGVVNKLTTAGFPCISPTSALSVIGNDRGYLRDLLSSYNMGEYNPRYRQFGVQNREDILQFITTELKEKFVIKHPLMERKKHDVIMGESIKSIPEAEKIFNSLIDSSYGLCLIEEKMEGDTFSIVSFTDSQTIHHSPVVKNYSVNNMNDIGCISMTDHKLPFLTNGDILTSCNIINNVIMAIQEETQEK